MSKETSGNQQIDECFTRKADLLEPYHMGPGDELTIRSSNFPEINTTVSVNGKGDIVFPLLGNVHADGLTVDKLGSLLKYRLNKEYLYNPKVTVKISTYRSRKLYVLGHVSQKGPFYLTKATRIFDLLAGVAITGSTEELFGDKKIVIIRKSCENSSHGDSETAPEVPETDHGDSETAPEVPETEVKTFSFNLKKLFVAREGPHNIELHPDDVLFISDAQNYYVIGAVGSPGAYSISDDDLSVLEAIVKAGGFNSSASKAVNIIRTIDGKQRKAKVKLDDTVKPGDIIEAKTSLF